MIENYKPSWFSWRYNALVVDFPKDLTTEILIKNNACYGYDPHKVLEGLKSAHELLKQISEEMLEIPTFDNECKKKQESVLSKINLLWYLFNLAECSNCQTQVS